MGELCFFGFSCGVLRVTRFELMTGVSRLRGNASDVMISIMSTYKMKETFKEVYRKDYLFVSIFLVMVH